MAHRVRQRAVESEVLDDVDGSVAAADREEAGCRGDADQVVVDRLLQVAVGRLHREDGRLVACPLRHRLRVRRPLELGQELVPSHRDHDARLR